MLEGRLPSKDRRDGLAHVRFGWLSGQLEPSLVSHKKEIPLKGILGMPSCVPGPSNYPSKKEFTKHFYWSRYQVAGFCGSLPKAGVKRERVPRDPLKTKTRGRSLHQRERLHPQRGGGERAHLPLGERRTGLPAGVSGLGKPPFCFREDRRNSTHLGFWDWSQCFQILLVGNQGGP